MAEITPAIKKRRIKGRHRRRALTNKWLILKYNCCDNLPPQSSGIAVCVPSFLRYAVAAYVHGRRFREVIECFRCQRSAYLIGPM